MVDGDLKQIMHSTNSNTSLLMANFLILGAMKKLLIKVAIKLGLSKTNQR